MGSKKNQFKKDYSLLIIVNDEYIKQECLVYTFKEKLNAKRLRD